MADFHRVHPEWPDECRRIGKHIVIARTLRRDYRLQIGWNRDDWGMVFVVNVLCLHIGVYVFKGERNG